MSDEQRCGLMQTATDENGKQTEEKDCTEPAYLKLPTSSPLPNGYVYFCERHAGELMALCIQEGKV